MAFAAGSGRSRIKCMRRSKIEALTKMLELWKGLEADPTKGIESIPEEDVDLYTGHDACCCYVGEKVGVNLEVAARLNSIFCRRICSIAYLCPQGTRGVENNVYMQWRDTHDRNIRRTHAGRMVARITRLIQEYVRYSADVVV